MNCCIQDLCEKDVINIKTGCCLGPVCDVEIDTEDGKLVAILVYGKGKLLGFGGKEGDIRIPWCDISVIGEDIILVGGENIHPHRQERRKGEGGLFR